MCAILIDRKVYMTRVSFITLRQLHWWMPNILTNTFHKSSQASPQKPQNKYANGETQKKGNNIMRENYEFAQKCIFHILLLCYLVKVASCVCMCCIFNWFCSITKRGIFVIWNQGNFYCIDAFVLSSLMKTLFYWISISITTIHHILDWFFSVQIKENIFILANNIQFFQ